MRILTIEPTPSPNTMKITLSEELGKGERNNYSNENKHGAPSYIQSLFDIEGIKAVYHVADFLAIERNPRIDWTAILPKVRAVFGEEVEDNEKAIEINEGFGEVKVFLQLFKKIPMQIKLVDANEEKRVGLPERFSKAVFEAQLDDDNVVLERKWVEQGVRYGELDEIGALIVEEVSAAYPKERLDELVQGALNKETSHINATTVFKKLTEEMLNDPDWQKRYAALDRIEPTEEDIPLLAKALDDEKASIRRLAVVYLGMLESKEVLPYLYKALKDDSVAVRRTAGDCLSDIGNPDAIPVMIESLQDKNKLVRWRAAMFLYEVGDESALEALKVTANDNEFEVALQARMAIERIETGEEAKGSVWKQMTEAMKESE